MWKITQDEILYDFYKIYKFWVRKVFTALQRNSSLFLLLLMKYAEILNKCEAKKNRSEFDYLSKWDVRFE